MLVLTRKIGEEIIINDDILISVEEIGPGRVKIGIVAPRDVPVHRKEVYDLIAAGGTPTPNPETETETVDGDHLNE